MCWVVKLTHLANSLQPIGLTSPVSTPMALIPGKHLFFSSKGGTFRSAAPFPTCPLTSLPAYSEGHLVPHSSRFLLSGGWCSAEASFILYLCLSPSRMTLKYHLNAVDSQTFQSCFSFELQMPTLHVHFNIE